MSAISKKLKPPSIEVLTSSSVSGLVNGADGLEESSAIPERHGSETEFRNQETRFAERCVFHDVLQFAALRFKSETYRNAKPAPDGRSSTN